MGLESPTYISDLVSTNPVGSDNISDGDAHIRNLKAAIKATFPNVTGAVTPTHTELNYVAGVTSALQTQLGTKAPTASPTFTGTITGGAMTLTGGAVSLSGATSVTVPTPSSSTHAATKAYVDGAVGTGAGVWTLLKSTTAASDATVDFVNGTGGVVISSTYDEYMITFFAVLPQTDATGLLVRTSTNAGSSYDSGSVYVAQRYSITAGTLTGAQATATAWNLAVGDQVGNDSGEYGVYGQMVFWQPSAAKKFNMVADVAFINNSAQHVAARTYGMNTTAADVDAIRFLFSGGNIASGTFNLYARRKS